MGKASGIVAETMDSEDDVCGAVLLSPKANGQGGSIAGRESDQTILGPGIESKDIKGRTQGNQAEQANEKLRAAFH
jgi:hypothetical protein